MVMREVAAVGDIPAVGLVAQFDNNQGTLKTATQTMRDCMTPSRGFNREKSYTALCIADSRGGRPPAGKRSQADRLCLSESSIQSISNNESGAGMANAVQLEPSGDDRLKGTSATNEPREVSTTT
jgi:hypothetical protein